MHIIFLDCCLVCNNWFDRLETLFLFAFAVFLPFVDRFGDMAICLGCFKETLVETDCNPNRKKLCKDIRCTTCFNKSLANHEKGKYLC